eukprot:m.220798 g.220798  ORF g.220798 m.220798 type:complete len:296 (-) comp19169_c0_seq3:27-914(-)
MDPKEFRNELLAGTLGGCAGLLVSQPFDVAKVRIQTQPHKFKSTFGCLAHSVKKEGVSKLFRGVMPPLLATGVVNGILFSSVGTAKRLQGLSNGDEPTVGQAFVSGAFGGGCTCFISVPAELVKCRQQVELGRVQTSFVQIAREIVTREGPMGLTTGWWATVARDVWSYGVYFSVYDFVSLELKDTLNDHYSSDAATMPSYMKELRILAAGSLAGIAAWTCSYPIDTIKSKYQTNSLGQRQRSWLVVGKHMIQEHGFSSLWRGYTACLLRSVPLNAVTFLVYEKTMEFFDDAPVF